jgi:hypothetical protein
MATFLPKNGVRFAPDRAPATAMMLWLTEGEVSEQSLVRWTFDNIAED